MRPVRLQAKFNVPDGMTRLDDFEGSPGAMPPDTFVVTRDRDGRPASLLGDLFWDFSAYNPEGRGRVLSFIYCGVESFNLSHRARCNEAQLIMFALIWRKSGAPLATGTLANYLSVLCALCLHADEYGVALLSLLGDDTALLRFARTRCSGWMAETLGSLLSCLNRLGENELGFVLVSSSTISSVKAIGKKYRGTLKQHPPMPTAVYSHVIGTLVAELDTWLHAADEVLPTLAACGADPLVGRSVLQQDEKCKSLGHPRQRRPTFEELASPGCISYIEQCGAQVQVKGLSYVVFEAQVVMKLLVQTFSGMREDESQALSYDCVEVVIQNGKSHYIIRGRTTKLNGGRAKMCKWVTNYDGYRAILAAQAIADVIYAIYGVDPRCSESRSLLPLFVSVGYMNLASTPMSPRAGRFVSGQMTIRPESRLNDLLSPILSEEDLRELEHIDPHRAWRSESDFKVGGRWNFTTHQLRRSLALYAQRSGLVSLPSLRRQLQHITEELARYYSRGSAYAKDFIKDGEGHFGEEWRDTQAESSGLSYLLNVILTADKLTGGHAHWAKMKIQSRSGTILRDRDATMRSFKKGEMAYRETLIGGCASTSGCDKPGMNILNVECLRTDCKSLVCSLPKLERVIGAQRNLVSKLPPSSVEYRTEMADLKVLNDARDAALAK